ncbi:MAG: HAD hydrolase-like protein [Clostridia bacterium]|nr:HAD hydrolase-like protein [Clostridia bacterium]
MFRYILFDFDGTVVNTGEGILKSLQYSFYEMGHEVPSQEELKKFIGPPVYYSFTHYYGIGEDKVGDYIRKYRERYKREGIYECELYKDMLTLLGTLKDSGYTLGIASSKPEHLIFDVADYLDITKYFDAVVGVKSDASRHTTKTGLILEAMDKLGVSDKSQVLMVGDRHYDITGAKGAGVSSCGCLWGYGNKEEFQECDADFIIEDPLDILNLLK